MELRHLRYFVAVAEEKSITVAATRRLRTARPVGYSRQLRELETEVGARLMTRSARGIELTAAGRTFLDHARLALAQVEAAASAARRAAHPEEEDVGAGVPERLRAGLAAGRDACAARGTAQDRGHHLQQAFATACQGSRDRQARRGLPEGGGALPRSRLQGPGQGTAARHSAERPSSRGAQGDRPEGSCGRDVHRHGRSGPGPALDHRRLHPAVGPRPRAGAQGRNISSMAVSLVASTRGVALLPDYAPELPDLVGGQPSAGGGGNESIDLVLGYHKANNSPLLKTFLSRVDDMVGHVAESFQETLSLNPRHPTGEASP